MGPRGRFGASRAAPVRSPLRVRSSCWAAGALRCGYGFAAWRAGERPRGCAAVPMGRDGYRDRRRRLRASPAERVRTRFAFEVERVRSRLGRDRSSRYRAHLISRPARGRGAEARGGRTLALHGPAEAPARPREPACVRLRAVGPRARHPRDGLRAHAHRLASASMRASMAVPYTLHRWRGEIRDAMLGRARGRAVARRRAGGARHRRPGLPSRPTTGMCSGAPAWATS